MGWSTANKYIFKDGPWKKILGILLVGNNNDHEINPIQKFRVHLVFGTLCKQLQNFVNMEALEGGTILLLKGLEELRFFFINAWSSVIQKKFYVKSLGGTINLADQRSLSTPQTSSHKSSLIKVKQGY